MRGLSFYFGIQNIVILSLIHNLQALGEFGEVCTDDTECSPSGSICIHAIGVPRTCECNAPDYRQEGDECKKSHETKCTVTSECLSVLTCTSGADGFQYCLCSLHTPQTFWSIAEDEPTCRPVEDLVVNVTDTSVGDTYLGFTWTAEDFGSGVRYYLEGTEFSISPTFVRGLQPGTRYSFFIKSTIFETGQYNNRRGTSRQWTATTSLSDHEAGCSSAADCLTGLQCFVGVDTDDMKHCLCEEDHGVQRFWDASSSLCKSVDELQVDINSTLITTSQLTLIWTANDFNLTNVTYTILVSEGSTPLFNQSETSSPSTIAGLIPGTEVRLIFFTRLPADKYYNEREIIVKQRYIMKPAQPGPVNISDSDFSNNPMRFAFGPSTGDVSYYLVVFTSMADGRNTYYEGIDVVVELYLEIGETYNYNIRAYNKDHVASEERLGNFTMDTAAPSPVATIWAETITPDTAEIMWTKSLYPNGNIKAFVVRILDQNSMGCMKLYAQKCIDCSGIPDLNLPDCAFSKTFETFLESNVAANSVHNFSQQFTELEPYRPYLVFVYAINEDYRGEENHVTFTTAEDVPSNIDSVILAPGINFTTMQVYLSVRWVPGPPTGETNFTVILKDVERNQNIQTNIIIGIENIRTKFEDVLANHQYSVSIFAETKVGKSPNTTYSNVVTSSYNKPGTARNLTILPDPIYAAKFSLNVECPPPNERNGTIESVNVTKISLDSSLTEQFAFPVSENCSISLLSTELGDFEASKNYSFSVHLKVEEFDSDSTEEVYFFSHPKPPIFEDDDDAIVYVTPFSEFQSEFSIQLRIDVPELTENSQGEIVLSAIIVCIKSQQNICEGQSRTKRSITSVNDVNNYINWTQAEANNFIQPYRTTPEEWLQQLVGDKYIVGGDITCSRPTNINAYCNGPLPDGKEVVVYIYRCTTGGCVESQQYTSKTKASKDGLSAGVIAAITAASVLCLIMIIILLVLILLRWRRGREKSTTDRIVESKPTKTYQRPVPIRNFNEIVARFHTNADIYFREEFEEIEMLSSQLKVTSDEALKKENRRKNRCVLPMDHSLVRLPTSRETGHGCDYINANYIPGFCYEREYIATEDPMPTTMPQFWRMVWEERAKIIVMLSEKTEVGNPNLYWPENINRPINYGDILVEMTDISWIKKCVIRKFRISVNEQRRHVTHFSVLGWRDFSTNLAFEDVLQFLQCVGVEEERDVSGPIVVHCNDGAGQTGTFIALDYFMQFINSHGLGADLDIFGFVMGMRSYRPDMVQTESQYIFIFDALVRMIERKLRPEQRDIKFKDGHEQKDAFNEGYNTNGSIVYNPTQDRLAGYVNCSLPRLVVFDKGKSPSFGSLPDSQILKWKH